jgi:rhodanese-related sulfurtransferase
LIRSTCFRTVVLIAVSSLAAVLTNAVRQDCLPWILDPNASLNPGENPALAQRVSISLEELRDHLDNMTASFVDARTPEEFMAGHLETAINIPSTEKEFYLDRVFEMLPPEGLIIIYCEGGECESSNEVFEFLLGNGFQIEHLRIFQPGWEFLGSLSDLPIREGTE